MTFKSKRTITNIVLSITLTTAYIIYSLTKNSPEPENLRAWATLMLIFIGIGIVAGIIIQILFHIALSIGVAIKEQESDGKKIERIITSSKYEDEMEKLIILKSTKINFICVTIGFIVSIVALSLGVTPVFALHIQASSFIFGSIIDGGMSIYLYERGVQNG